MSILGSLIGGAIKSNATSKAKDALITGAEDANTSIQDAQGKVQSLYAPGVDLYNRSTNALSTRAGIGDGLGNGPTSATVPNAMTATGSGSGISAGSFGDLTNPTQATVDRPTALSTSANDFMESPDYQFLLQRGLDGVNSSFAHNGALNSGAAIKGAINYASGLASTKFDDWRDSNIAQNQQALSQFNTDRTNAQGQYADARDYLTGRYDTQTQDLANLANGSQNAITATGNSLTTQGVSGANAATAIGNARAGNKLLQGDIWSGATDSVDGQLSSNKLAKVASSTIANNPYLF